MLRRAHNKLYPGRTLTFVSDMSYQRNLPRLATPARCFRVLGAYWMPNPQFVDELAQFLKGKRVLEVFAGNGFLASLLAAQGVSIRATTRFSGHDAHEHGLYHDVEDVDAVTAVRQYAHAHDVLLMCWPTVTPAALLAVAEWGVDRDLVYIGEVTDYQNGHLAGCATDEFFACMAFTQRFKSYRGNMLEAALVGRLNPDALARLIPTLARN